MKTKLPTRVSILMLATMPTLAMAAAPASGSLSAAQDSVVNLLQALVNKGVMTQEQALAMVADAQLRTENEVKSRRSEAAAVTAPAVAPLPVAPPPPAPAPAVAAVADTRVGAGDVRVTYVPQIVKDEIRDQVRAEVTPQVVDQVMQRAKEEKWGVPGALPAWVANLRFNADVRVREQADLFASDNAEFAYLDFVTVNDRGGIGKAGAAALLNTTQDRMRTRVRVRAGVEAKLSDSFTAGLRLATGNFRDPVSTNQTLSQVGGRYTVGLDQAYIRYDARATKDWSWLTATGGRMANPYVSTDMVWDPDLTFEGFTVTGRMGLGNNAKKHNAFLTVGAYPLEEVELSSKDKWLYAVQTGVDWKFSNQSRLRGSVAYYMYDNIAGKRNPLDSTVYDFTAPRWLQKGNTLFDIRNDVDPTTNLFALAADYELVDVIVAYDMPMFDRYQLSLLADYVRNVGYDRAAVARRLQLANGAGPQARTEGYQLEVGFGYPRVDRARAWRASLQYRYLQRDAVLDAFTDSDLHLGGTDTQGYVLRGDYGLTKNVYLSLRYLSANEIDGPPLGIDTVMLDLNGQF
jgi:hypothetical protein